MLKNSFLGRRDEPSATNTSGRASPESPRYPPNAEASAPAPAPAPVSTPAASTTPAATKDTGARLTVGPNIKLKGAEINDCDTLVVEGHVEASMNSQTLEIGQTGSYVGTVTIDVAEIHGRFEGNLTARKKLIVHASGRVSGTVRYGLLLVSEGGVLSGDVAALEAEEGKGESSSTASGEAQSPSLFAGYPSSRGKGNNKGGNASSGGDSAEAAAA